MRSFAVIALILMGLAQPSLAERRIALVIGNGGYTAVTPLDNARNDAALLAATLETLNFEVTHVRDARKPDLARAIAEFGATLRAAGPESVGLFYYAGHGVQSFGANYLLPVDASLTVAADLDLVGLEASAVLRQMASARNHTNIVILDACRDNPFESVADINDNGLAEMKAPTGTFLAYATAPGEVAFDGTGANSPFTSALARAMQVEGLAIEQVFKQVRNEVLAQTGGLQTPWDTSSLTRDFRFRPGPVQTPEQIAEEQLWQSVSKSGDPVQVMLFLRSYPEGLHARDARTMLGRLMAEEFAAAPETTTPETTTPATAAKPPPDTETALMEAARASGRIEDYQAYVDAHPDGVFSELVRIEIAALRQGGAAPPDSAAAAAQAPDTASQPAPDDPPRVVLFDRPLEHGVPEIVGKTLLQVTRASPLFPPIDGLPEAMWKGQSCSNCHSWTREALCEQASFYLGENASRSLQKRHPFGGSFKRNLRHWAANDCR